jgi:hypothetical protein
VQKLRRGQNFLQTAAGQKSGIGVHCWRDRVEGLRVCDTVEWHFRVYGRAVCVREKKN